jgi:ketosteroid isomerase-like protein
MRTFLWPVIVLLSFDIASAQRTFDPREEAAKLLRRDAEWADLATAGKDLEKIVSYFTDDVLFIPSGQQTIEGKAAVRAFVDASLKMPGFKIHWVSEKPVFSPDGKVAYMRGTSELTLPGPSGSTTTSRTQGITIWRLESDGQWRCAVEISTEQPPAATPASP